MKRVSHLRYMRGDQVHAGELNMERLPLKEDVLDLEVGSVDGALIDIVHRRVAYLVADTWHGRRLIPFEGVWIDQDEPSLHLVAAQPEQWERFDPSSVDAYDDEAVMELLFHSPAA